MNTHMQREAEKFKEAKNYLNSNGFSKSLKIC